jgi:CheY-like chemotaxis protein
MKAPAGARILVVEDNPDDAFFLERAFRKAGLAGFDRVLGSGGDAINYLSGQGCFSDRGSNPLPSHLVLDLKIPKVSGLEVLGWIREQPALRELRVVVLSSSGERRDLEQAEALGVDGYFIKPTGSIELVEIVREIGRRWGLS